MAEYLFEKQRLLLRADPTMTDRSMTQAILLGLPFYLRQQYKLLRPTSLRDLLTNVDVISVRPKKKFEGKTDEKKARVNQVDGQESNSDFEEPESLN